MIRLRHWLVVASLVVAGTAEAGPRDALGAFSKDLKGLDGQFTQQVFDPNGRLKETSNGRVAMSAPRLFRWEYIKPYPQLIVADGQKVWVYDPDLMQVTVRTQGVEEQNSPLAALIDPARLDRDFNVREASSEGGLQWLELTPKQGADAGFQNARLGFDANGLARMQVLDALGQRTDIRFTGWKKNPSFPRTTFRYTPAPGVDVVGEG